MQGDFLLVVLLTLLESDSQAVQLGPQETSVLLRQGAVRGMRVLTETRQGVLAFLGIPYAEPPVGELRFSAPVRHRGWNGTLTATSFRPACPQPDPGVGVGVGAASTTAPADPSPADSTLEQDEDCLYLNVWTPEGATPYRPVPVILVLEGRGFVAGTPSQIPAQDLAAEGVVVVSVSYRLNVFGFLCLEDSGSRGNMGLLDQYLALLWVRDNVEAFGGDPHTITLMGHGAGAASVALHMTSPRTLGLFQRAILMSGSAVSPWSKSPSASAASRGVARSLGCPLPPPYAYEERQLRPPSSPTLDCLRTKSTPEVLRAFLNQYQAGNWTDLPLPVSDYFLPPEEQYLPRGAHDAMAAGAIHQIPIITGVTAHDGTVVLHEYRDLSRQSYTQLRRFFVGAAIPALARRYGFTSIPSRWPRGDVADDVDNHIDFLDSRDIEVPADSTIRSLLEWKYVASATEGDPGALRAGLLQIYTDAQFKAPHIQQMKLLSARSSQLFAYRLDQPSPDLFGSGLPGAGYGAELVLLLGPSLLRQVAGRRFSPQEERLAAQLKRMWTDFARTGNPTPGARGYGVTWQRYDSTDQAFLSLNADAAQPFPMHSYIAGGPSSTGLEDSRAALLWNSYLPRLHNESITNRLWAASREAPLTNAQPFRSAMFTLLALVLLLLLLLIMCLVLLKRRAKERERDSF